MKKFLSQSFLRALALGGAIVVLGSLFSPVHCLPLAFASPKRLAVIPWSSPSHSGAPLLGAEGLMVDSGGLIYLESGLDFIVYSANGKYLRTFQASTLKGEFFGFSGMEALPNGKLLLLARLESPREQANKDNFEERSRPGARLLVLDNTGKILSDQEYLDKSKPHSAYFLDQGEVYSLHDDGTCARLDSSGALFPPDPILGGVVKLASTPRAWLEHVKSLPVFSTGDRSYHDTQGNIHWIKGAVSFLMGRSFVEGMGPLGVRQGRIYYQILCNKNRGFLPAVFVENPLRKDYGLVELLPADEDLDITHPYSLFVDKKGDIYEGVAKKDGYRIYKWSLLR